MPNVLLDFTLAEYKARLNAVHHAMAQSETDVLIITDPSNMAWVSGYDGWSFYVHQCVVVPGGEQPIWFGRAQDANGAFRTVYMDDDRVVGYPDHYVQSTERHPMEMLAALMMKNGWGAKSIAVEMDNYYFSAAAFMSLKSTLPNAKFNDATGQVNWLRAVKSETELDYMRIAGKIVTNMHQRIREKAMPGMRKCDLVAEIYDAGLRGVDGYGGDYPAIVPLLPSGADASAPHLTWDDAPIKNGQGTFFEIAGCYKRYHCPISRSLYFGTPPMEILEAEKAVLEGLDAGLDVAKSGNTCEHVAGAFFGVLERYGITKSNRTGYSIGLSYPPDWGERTMSLRKGDQTVLQNNMTFHFMTGLWMQDWGLEITESIIINDGYPELLGNVPRALVVKS